MTGGRGARRRAARPQVAVVTLLAAAAGAGLGAVLAQERPAQRPHDGPRRIGLASGVARLPLPAGWVPLHRYSSLPGLQDATAVRGAHSVVALDTRPPEHPSLLPTDVRAASAGNLPAPRLRRLDRRSVWGYEISDARSQTSLVAMALPTTGGVVTIACQADVAAISGATEDCAMAMSALHLEGASALAPAPETAARIVLPEVVADLNRKRRGGRRALAATRSPRRRAAAARDLAFAYGSAAERLRPVAAGDARRLTAALADLARRHRELAAASRRRDARLARRAGAAVERGERRLAPLLAAVSN